ncbi:glycoside hydrolase family 9 protein [Massilia endophytica]|uniref:glycoside hydrolase family 9 protein n=1 Tax=Massilia endophytica TaxID=2899220 RepID=UPI001E579602|nr:glycoside hydrolase family 9 protein [Massilia endophytica]UGQ47407.1 glycoside hydrolase family 9 protein [Massilia endophytica]
MRAGLMVRAALLLTVVGMAPGSVAGPVLVGLHTAAPDVLVAVVLGNPGEEDGFTSVPDTVDLDPAHWRVNGLAPVALSRISMPVEEDRINWSTLKYPVTVQHKLYLRLNQPVQEGAAYSVSGPYGTRSMIFDSASTFCESIKVNQVGYSPRGSSRFANFGAYMGTGGSIRFAAPPAYEVADADSGIVVASGTAVYMGDETYTGAADDPNRSKMVSGEHVYRLGLNSVPVGGPYYVKVPGCGRSYAFGVGDAYVREAAYVATRGLYHQRCGIALEQPYTDFTRAICHPQIAHTRATPDTDRGVPVPPGYEIHPMSGGHHDAGNFQRLYEHMMIPVLMMGYYEAFPGNFVDSQYNLPESGNGIPDFLDEALWAVKSWENLQIQDPLDTEYGGVMAGTVEQPGEINNFYGFGSAANTPGLQGTWPVTMKATAMAAGLFAQASRLLRPFDPERANVLLNRAELAWAFVTSRADINTPAVHFMYGALQIYLATGNAAAHAAFKHTVQLVVITPTPTSWPEVWLPGNISSTTQTPHFISYLLPNGMPKDAVLFSSLSDKVLQQAEEGTYMGPPPENLPYPQGVSKFLGWGSGTAQGRYADLYAFAWLLTSDPARKQKYVNAVSQYADYAMGLNPLGMSYYTGLGWEQPNSPLHEDSYFTKYGASDGITSDHVGRRIGNVPGMLVLGPVGGASGQGYQMAVTNKVYPPIDTEMPPMRRFAHGWSFVHGNEMTTAGTNIWNLVMLGFLYNASADATGVNCTSPQPLIDSEQQSCPSGQVGSVTRQRTYSCRLGQWSPDTWQALGNNCTPACTGPQPPDENRYGGCPAGQVGAIGETRSYSCVAGSWMAGTWRTTSNTCAVPPPPAPICKYDPLGNSLTVSGLSTLACVSRNDTGEQRIPVEGQASFAGAPASGMKIYTFSGVNQYGHCVNQVGQASCIVPVPANPVCTVSPWDGSLTVNGLGTEIPCVSRNDTGKQALSVDGKVVFNDGAPAAGMKIYTFSDINLYGHCVNQVGQHSCTAIPAPTPACTVNTDGSLLVNGLNASIACVSRNDTGDYAVVTGSEVSFTGAPPSPATKIYTFSGINIYGACVQQVGQLSCTTAP